MTWASFIVHFDQWWATVTFATAAVFVFYYGFAAPWYKTPFGRALIVIDLGLAVATLPEALMFTLHRNIYDNRLFAWITLIIAAFIPVAITYRIITMWAVRHKTSWLSLRAKQNDSNNK